LHFLGRIDSVEYKAKKMKKILLVDDELAAATVFKKALETEGFEVKLAANGRDGLSLAKTETFDLILLDQMLPDMQGQEVLETLKQDAATKDIPVVMLTNFGAEDMVKKALEKGATEYILKYQIATDDLVQKVKKILGEKS
jgi:CheY-like chemotaxis protein